MWYFLVKMDRSWITKNLLSLEYGEGVEHFLNFAQDGATIVTPYDALALNVSIFSK